MIHTYTSIDRHLYISSICVCVYVYIHIHVDIGSHPNRSLNSGLEGLPFLILMLIAEEDFLWLCKVLRIRFKWVAMQSQVLMFSEQSLEKPRDIEKYILSTTYEPWLYIFYSPIVTENCS